MLTEKQEARRKQFEKYYETQANKRQEDKAKRIEVKIQTKDPRELQLYIQTQFKSNIENILKPINEKLVKTEEQIDQLIDEFKALFQYYVDINYALISYDKQQYKEQLEQLECTLYNLRQHIVPRQKFRFSKPFPGRAAGQQEIEQETHEDLRKQAYLSDSIIINPSNFRDRIEIQDGSLVLQNLQDTTFTVVGSLDTLYLHSLRNVKVELGDVRGSVWVEKCVNCKFVGKMHQLRIHDTETTEFVIFITSNPIIERSTGLRFGCLESAPRDGKANCWNQVQDFNWLKQEKSPNFMLI